jgi:hypothetical protein
MQSISAAHHARGCALLRMESDQETTKRNPRAVSRDVPSSSGVSGRSQSSG